MDYIWSITPYGELLKIDIKPCSFSFELSQTDFVYYIESSLVISNKDFLKNVKDFSLSCINPIEEF